MFVLLACLFGLAVDRADAVVRADLCQTDDCEQGHTNIQVRSNYFGRALTKFFSMAAGKFFIGFDLEWIGQICSFFVGCTMILYAIYFTISWIIRFILFKQEGIKLE